MFALPEDLLLSLLGGWMYDGKDLCKVGMCGQTTAEKLEPLYKHPGFVLKPDRYLTEDCVSWLQSKHIKVNLLVEHRVRHHEDKESHQWLQNGWVHRDNDLPAVITFNGGRLWYQNGLIHRDNDLPAVMSADGDTGTTWWQNAWYQNGKLNRGNDMPAVVRGDGSQCWYQNGELHRGDDLPAIIDAEKQCWYRNGKHHRDDDLPASIYANGDKEWYQNGKVHRGNDLPAIMKANGDQMWYKNGELHRDNNLPALIYANGYMEWYVNGYWCSDNDSYDDFLEESEKSEAE